MRRSAFIGTSRRHRRIARYRFCSLPENARDHRLRGDLRGAHWAYVPSYSKLRSECAKHRPTSNRHRNSIRSNRAKKTLSSLMDTDAIVSHQVCTRGNEICATRHATKATSSFLARMFFDRLHILREGQLSPPQPPCQYARDPTRSRKLRPGRRFRLWRRARCHLRSVENAKGNGVDPQV
jgi:hypothetical protein